MLAALPQTDVAITRGGGGSQCVSAIGVLVLLALALLVSKLAS
jgi:hypothetical protein